MQCNFFLHTLWAVKIHKLVHTDKFQTHSTKMNKLWKSMYNVYVMIL